MRDEHEVKCARMVSSRVRRQALLLARPRLHRCRAKWKWLESAGQRLVCPVMRVRRLADSCPVEKTRGSRACALKKVVHAVEEADSSD